MTDRFAVGQWVICEMEDGRKVRGRVSHVRKESEAVTVYTLHQFPDVYRAGTSATRRTEKSLDNGGRSPISQYG